MKKYIFLIVLFVTSVICVLGQNKLITEKEYNSALGNSVSKADKIPFRITDITKFYKNQKLDETRTFVSENLPPDKERWMSSRTANNEILESMESITIGKVKYTKKNNEKWETFDLTIGNSSGSFKLSDALETKDIHQYMLIKTTLDGQPSDLYFHYHVFQLKGILYFLESKDWLNAEGLILKSTTKQSNVTPENITSLTTRTYEYNPKDLKIEAPKIKEK